MLKWDKRFPRRVSIDMTVVFPVHTNRFLRRRLVVIGEAAE